MTLIIISTAAEFYSCPSVIGGSQAEQPATEPLATLVPRLWPFLRHTLSSVRFAALKTLERLLSMGAGDVSLWLPRVLSSALSNLFQNFILEEKSEIVEETQTVWQMIVTIVQVRSFIVHFNVLFGLIPSFLWANSPGTDTASGSLRLSYDLVLCFQGFLMSSCCNSLSPTKIRSRFTNCT